MADPDYGAYWVMKDDHDGAQGPEPTTPPRRFGRSLYRTLCAGCGDPIYRKTPPLPYSYCFTCRGR